MTLAANLLDQLNGCALLRFFVFGLTSQLPMQGLGHLPRRMQPRAAGLLHLAHLLFEQNQHRIRFWSTCSSVS
jgi:hypothetical protein